MQLNLFTKLGSMDQVNNRQSEYLFLVMKSIETARIRYNEMDESIDRLQIRQPQRDVIQSPRSGT